MSDHLQEDFPIEWEEDHSVTRREFFKFLTLASGGIAVGTTALALIAKLPRTERRFEPAQICTVADLRPGSALPFTYPCPTDLCILVCTREGEYRAFTRRCTHLSCPVVYRADERGALEKLVARRREENPLRHCAGPVARPPDALKPNGNRTGRPHLTHQVDRTDVDAELE